MASPHPGFDCCCDVVGLVGDAAAKVWIEGRIGGGYVVLRSTAPGALYPPQ